MLIFSRCVTKYSTTSCSLEESAAAAAAAGEEEGEQRAHEPFYLDVEPKGGWTMTDLVGFPFASDIDMLHHRWQPNSKQVLIEP